MSHPFPDHYKEIADGMGIALYQKFLLEEASLFLRCPKQDLQAWSQAGDIESIMLPAGETQFFGYQLIRYLIEYSTPSPPFEDSGHGVDRIIRMPEVERITGVSRSTICRKVKNGDFPEKVRLGGST